jgi:hypothetical protein
MALIKPEDKGTWEEVIQINEAIEHAYTTLSAQGPVTPEAIVERINDPDIDIETVGNWLRGNLVHHIRSEQEA